MSSHEKFATACGAGGPAHLDAALLVAHQRDHRLGERVWVVGRTSRADSGVATAA